MERELRAEPGATGFVASNDALVYVLLWFELVAAAVPLVTYIFTEDKSVRAMALTPKGPLDRCATERCTERERRSLSNRETL